MIRTEAFRLVREDVANTVKKVSGVYGMAIYLAV